MVSELVDRSSLRADTLISLSCAVNFCIYQKVYQLRNCAFGSLANLWYSVSDNSRIRNNQRTVYIGMMFHL